jgi:hypothetical protein
MVKIAIAIGLIFLLAAFSVFASPFFAILLVLPAIMIVLALTGAAVVSEETGEGVEGDEREPDPTNTSRAGKSS